MENSAELPERPARVVFPCGSVDLANGEITYLNGAREVLSRQEAAVLRFLVERRGRLATRDEMLVAVWRLDPSSIRTRTIDMHISKLRRKLQSGNEGVLRTVRGQGYILHL